MAIVPHEVPVAKAIAPDVDALLVIGAPNSSNSKRLVEVARAAKEESGVTFVHFNTGYQNGRGLDVFTIYLGAHRVDYHPAVFFFDPLLHYQPGELEMQAIYHALERHAGNKPSAAEELGVSLKTLYNKLNQAQSLEKSA